MSHPSLLERITSVFRAPFSGSDSQEGSPGQPDASDQRDSTEDSGIPTFPDASHTRSELASKVGKTPETYVRILVEERGAIRQQTLIELSGLSASATSRLLQEMEDDEEIQRIQYGREKIVADPDASITDLGLRQRGWPLLLLAVSLRYYSRLAAWSPSVVTRVTKSAARALTWIGMLGYRYLGRFFGLILRFLPRFP